MTQRLFDSTKLLWSILVLYSGHIWNPVSSVAVRTPPKIPTTIESQAKFFQDFFSVQLSPYNIEFGHVCEDPNTWEQRYEKKDFKNHRDMGKVRWGDKKGGYGEHYWDLNHAGHAGDHEDNSDDGSYNEDAQNRYEEPSEQYSKYEAEEYNPVKSSQYEESGRIKRADSKVKPKGQNNEEDADSKNSKHKHTQSWRKQYYPADYHESESIDEREENESLKIKQQMSTQNNEDNPQKVKNDIVLVVSQKDRSVPDFAKRPETKNFVPYESGAGIRQHHRAEIAASASVPRLFLEHSTGHIVDRATGQAYVLHPVVPRYHNYHY